MSSDLLKANAKDRSEVDNEDRMSVVEAHRTQTPKKNHLWIRLDVAEDILKGNESEIKKLSALVRAYRVGGNDALRHENIELNAKIEALRYDVANLIEEIPVKQDNEDKRKFNSRMQAWKERMCSALKVEVDGHAPIERKQPKSTAWMTDRMI
jgi:hypothetical protein